MNQIVKNNPLLVFFTLAYLFTWSNWIPQALISRGMIHAKVPGLLIIIAGYGPAFSAIIVTSLVSGRTGIRKLFSKLLLWRSGIKWYAVVLLLPAVIATAGLALQQLLGYGSAELSKHQLLNLGPPGSSVFVQILLLAFVFIIGFDGFGEEFGWRGFALPRMLEKYSALMASLVLGVLWAFWHLPYAMTLGTSMSEHPFYYFIPGIVASSILTTWIYNNTKGSILMAILFHATGNLSYMVLPVFFPGIDTAGIFISVVQWAVVIVILFIEGPQYLSRGKRPKKNIAFT